MYGCLLCFLLPANDYEALQQNMTLSSVQNRSCINITITNDSVPEPEEFFQVALTNLSRISANVTEYQVAIAVTNITIIDDDGEYTSLLVLTCSMQKKEYSNMGM